MKKKKLKLERQRIRLLNPAQVVDVAAGGYITLYRITTRPTDCDALPPTWTI